MDGLLRVLLTNAVAAGALAAVAWLASRVVRRPGLSHALWLLALLRLVMPPLVSLPILPADAALTPAASVDGNPTREPGDGARRGGAGASGAGVAPHDPRVSQQERSAVRPDSSDTPESVPPAVLRESDRGAADGVDTASPAVQRRGRPVEPRVATTGSPEWVAPRAVETSGPARIGSLMIWP